MEPNSYLEVFGSEMFPKRWMIIDYYNNNLQFRHLANALIQSVLKVQDQNEHSKRKLTTKPTITSRVHLQQCRESNKLGYQVNNEPSICANILCK